MLLNKDNQFTTKSTVGVNWYFFTLLDILLVLYQFVIE